MLPSILLSIEPCTNTHTRTTNPYVRVMYTWMSHLHTYVNESCHTYVALLLHVGHVNSHTWKSTRSHMQIIHVTHVTHVHGSRHTYEWVTSHTLMRHFTDMWTSQDHVTHMWTSQDHTHPRVQARIYLTWMCSFTRTNDAHKPGTTYGISHKISHITQMNESCHTCSAATKKGPNHFGVATINRLFNRALLCKTAFQK